MITNIILGVILVAILVIFFILDNKINKIKFYLTDIINKLDSTYNTTLHNNNIITHSLDKFNDFKLYYKSNNTNLKDALTQINNCTNAIYDKVIRIKSAKISSKNESYSKTNKSINK